MKFLQQWLWRRSVKRGRQQRLKAWEDTGLAELCLPQETIDLLETQSDIPPFWKSVLLSISDHTGALVHTETILFNTLSLSIQDAHPNASREERAAVMSELLSRGQLATQKLDLEDLLDRPCDEEDSV